MPTREGAVGVYRNREFEEERHVLVPIPESMIVAMRSDVIEHGEYARPRLAVIVGKAERYGITCNYRGDHADA